MRCDRSDLSTPFCDDILDILSTQPEETKTYFRCYADLKEVRNGLAHRLCAVTADEIRAACGKTPEQIISLIERCILLLFPACDPEVFHIYGPAQLIITSGWLRSAKWPTWKLSSTRTSRSLASSRKPVLQSNRRTFYSYFFFSCNRCYGDFSLSVGL